MGFFAICFLGFYQRFFKVIDFGFTEEKNHHRK